MVSRILCAIDDTEPSETAAEFPISLASSPLEFHSWPLYLVKV